MSTAVDKTLFVAVSEGTNLYDLHCSLCFVFLSYICTENKCSYLHLPCGKTDFISQSLGKNKLFQTCLEISKFPFLLVPG